MTIDQEHKMTPKISENPIENLSPYRKKLYWRAIKRGMKEADLILGGFARQYLPSMTDDQVRQFEEILSLFDADFLNYITGKKTIPHDLNNDVFRAIQSYKPYEN